MKFPRNVTWSNTKLLIFLIKKTYYIKLVIEMGIIFLYNVFISRINYFGGIKHVQSFTFIRYSYWCNIQGF